MCVFSFLETLNTLQWAQLNSSKCILIQQFYDGFGAVIEFVTEAPINDEAGVKALGLDLHDLGLAPAPPLLGAWKSANWHRVSQGIAHDRRLWIMDQLVVELCCDWFNQFVVFPIQREPGIFN